eukprot:12348240-Alexandrium_andersonii.AAC.1
MHPRKLRGSTLRPFLDPRSSSSECLQHFCMLSSSGSERLLCWVNAGRCRPSQALSGAFRRVHPMAGNA